MAATETASIEALRKSVAEDSLYQFVKQAWHIIEPGKPFVDNWHLRLLCAKLEAVSRREIKRLIINVPPRSGKSSIACALWPVWTWLRDPSHQWLTISHSSTFATRDALKSRRVIESPWFQSRWGHKFELTGDQNQKTRYENDKRGYRIALGITAGITGEGGDTILLDDPHDRDSAHSDIERASALTTYDEAISTRLNEPAKGAIVVIMQRLHVNDLTGHLLAGAEHWDHLCLPMEFEAAHPYRCGEDERKSDGEPLWPARFTPEVVKTLTVRLGSYGAAGQLQQRPNPKGGGVWKTAMLRFYTERPTQWDSLVQSWDMSFKKTTDGSFVVGQVWGKRGANMYLLDEVRERMGYAATRNAMRALKSKWPNALAILVEDKANGPAIMDDLRNEIPGLIAVDTGSDSKMARAESIAPLIESGNVYLPHPSIAPWVNDWLGEVERFPQEPNDRVDAATHALKHMAGDAWADLRANLAALDW